MKKIAIFILFCFSMLSRHINAQELKISDQELFIPQESLIEDLISKPEIFSGEYTFTLSSESKEGVDITSIVRGTNEYGALEDRTFIYQDAYVIKIASIRNCWVSQITNGTIVIGKNNSTNFTRAVFEEGSILITCDKNSTTGKVIFNNVKLEWREGDAYKNKQK